VNLAVFIGLTVVQVAPSYSSVAAEGLNVPVYVLPPEAKPAVCVPDPANWYLAVFKGLEFVQELPSYSSVAPVTGLPPKAKAAV
jgi:hypothetical protein